VNLQNTQHEQNNSHCSQANEASTEGRVWMEN